VNGIAAGGLVAFAPLFSEPTTALCQPPASLGVAAAGADPRHTLLSGWCGVRNHGRIGQDDDGPQRSQKASGPPSDASISATAPPAMTVNRRLPRTSEIPSFIPVFVSTPIAMAVAAVSGETACATP